MINHRMPWDWTEEQLLAQARQHMWTAWQLSSEELASKAASTLLGLGMLVPEGGAAELEHLCARLAELEARLAEYERPVDEDPIAYALTEQTAEPDFFQPGHTYTKDAGPHTAPETHPTLRCIAVAEHPTRGSRRAFGFLQLGAGARWVSASLRDEEWAEGWTDVTGVGE